MRVEEEGADNGVNYEFLAEDRKLPVLLVFAALALITFFAFLDTTDDTD